MSDEIAAGYYIKRATDVDLIEELGMRGYVVYDSHGYAMPPRSSVPPAVRALTHPAQADPPEAEADLDRWLEVWAHVDIARLSTSTPEVAANLEAALRYLLTLIQPPSVRVARQVSASSEASSQT
ncbi:MAG TPA: hypothetical protein VJW23_14615 [Propionibacteriaceae bacterium]|nr:hypothetical protein [Propionibacteriaceae bacterium]